jgi:hypothetical protein
VDSKKVELEEDSTNQVPTRSRTFAVLFPVRNIKIKTDRTVIVSLLLCGRGNLSLTLKNVNGFKVLSISDVMRHSFLIGIQ